MHNRVCKQPLRRAATASHRRVHHPPVGDSECLRLRCSWLLAPTRLEPSWVVTTIPVAAGARETRLFLWGARYCGGAFFGKERCGFVFRTLYVHRRGKAQLLFPRFGSGGCCVRRRRAARVRPRSGSGGQSEKPIWYVWGVMLHD